MIFLFVKQPPGDINGASFNTFQWPFATDKLKMQARNAVFTQSAGSHHGNRRNVVVRTHDFDKAAPFEIQRSEYRRPLTTNVFRHGLFADAFLAEGFDRNFYG